MNPNQFEEKRRNAILRADAETQLTLAPAQEGENRPAEELLYELRVHRIELEMQNEELRRAQAALEESRDRYLDLYAFAPVGYLTLSREGLIDEINLTGATFLGVERKKLLRRRFDSFVAPEDRNLWQHQFTSMVKHEVGRQKFELELQRGNGSVFYGRLDCLRVEMDNAPPVVRVTLADIDELKRSEILLRASNERVNLLLASTGEGIYAVDEMGRCTLANPACAKLLGYATPEELLGRDMHSLMHYQHADGSAYPAEECPVHNAMHSAQPTHQREDRFWRADGSSFPVALSACPMIREGVAVGTVVNFNDITARRQAEEQLRHLNETLEQRVQEETSRNMAQERLLIHQSRLAAMGEMIANIAHQWRQPLNTIGLVVQNIQVDFQENQLSKEALEEYVATAMKTAQRMSNTIDDFRNFFNPSEEKQHFLVCDGVADAIKLVGPGLANNDIEIIQGKRCPSSAVYGHSNEFAQVLVNILSNARDAIAGKNIAGKIHITVANRGDTVTVTIRNNGGNIPDKVLGKVFDPYFTTKASGTGLGLFMSKMIVDNMGGDINICNTEDGVEVLLTLPLDKPA